MNKFDYRQQSGMTLIVSLVILISMTIMGVTSMQSTRTEVSMAGNLRESALTFNAAEAGLRAAERFVTVSISKNEYTDPNEGLFGENDEDPDYADSESWQKSQVALVSIPHVVSAPKFIIRYLGDRAQNEAATINIGGYGGAQPGTIVSNFRITARGVGQTGNSYRYVQSYFGKEY